MSEHKAPETEQEEPGPVPPWMTWVGGEIKAVRTELKAEIKASEERQGKLLRTELKATESRLRADVSQQISDAVSRVTTLFGVMMGFLVLLVTVLAVFVLQQNGDRIVYVPFPSSEMVAPAPQATPLLPEGTQAVVAQSVTEAEGPRE